jgi:hypothetical protein
VNFKVIAQEVSDRVTRGKIAQKERDKCDSEEYKEESDKPLDKESNHAITSTLCLRPNGTFQIKQYICRAINGRLAEKASFFVLLLSSKIGTDRAKSYDFPKERYYGD